MGLKLRYVGYVICINGTCYFAAGSVIRMMEHFVTTEVFQRGLSKYLDARLV